MEDELYEVRDQHFQSYEAYLAESSRPPSKGGNTSALHRHVLVIDGAKYSFFARGTKKFAYKGELISFKYKKVEVNGKVYQNIERDSIISKDKNGTEYLRGDRSYKAKLRTAPARLPGSRREQR